MKKLVSTGLVLAALLSVPVASYADVIFMPVSSHPITSQELVLGPLSCEQSILPRLTVNFGADYQLKLINPAPYPVTFNAPNLGISYMVPANSERVLFVDRTAISGLTPGQEIGYYVTDGAGNRLAVSSIIAVPAVASTVNTNTAIMVENQPLFTRTEVRRSTVRGFW